MPNRQHSDIRIRFRRRAAVIALISLTSLGLPVVSALADQQQNRNRPGRGARILMRLGILPEPKPAPPAKQPPPASQPASIQVPANRVERVNSLPLEAAAPKEQPPIHVATEEERNQTIAPGWKDPWIVFFVTGRQSGYMEPCGCTGLENQKGGLMRRDSLLANIKSKGWNVIPIDSGDQVRSRGKQSEIKFARTAEAFSMMDYAAVGYGEEDLRLSQDTLIFQLINVPTDSSGNSNALFVSANVSIFPDLDTTHKIIRVGKRKIGITAVLGDERIANLKGHEDSMTFKPAKESLIAIKKKLDAEQCDYNVLIANASLEESRELAKEVPGFDLVVTAGGYGEPTYRPEEIAGTKSKMVQVGTKGMYAGLVGLFDDPNEPLRYQRLALSSQFEDSPRIVELFTKYQDQLKAEGMERLGKRPQNHPTLREFVGSEKCGECHTSAYDVWLNSAHAHATDSIVNPPERNIPRNFDPECISCHTTGWNPQEFFPYKTGFESLEASPLLVGNGCENCHGPGKNHVDAESGDIDATDEMLARLRQEMQLPLDKAHDKCLECHDIDNSPDFHATNAFEEYWEKIKHGKD